MEKDQTHFWAYTRQSENMKYASFDVWHEAWIHAPPQENWESVLRWRKKDRPRVSFMARL